MRYFIRKDGVLSAINELTNPSYLSNLKATWTEITEAEYLDRQPKEVEINVNELKINELKQKLSDTDYKLFKYLEGDLTKEEYLPIMENRKRWRREINELEGESAHMPAQIK